MNRPFLALTALLTLAACQKNEAAPAPAAEVSVTDAIIRLAPIEGRPSAAYFTLHGGKVPDRLEAVTSPRAATIDLHESKMQGGFFKSLATKCGSWGCRRLFFKDVEPGHVRSLMSLLADWYITGDRHVVLFPRAAFGDMATRYFPGAMRSSMMPDRPNYCEVLSW